MKFFAVKFSPSACFVVSLRPKSAHASYRHPETVFVPYKYRIEL